MRDPYFRNSIKSSESGCFKFKRYESIQNVKLSLLRSVEKKREAENDIKRNQNPEKLTSLIPPGNVDCADKYKFHERNFVQDIFWKKSFEVYYCFQEPGSTRNSIDANILNSDSSISIPPKNTDNQRLSNNAIEVCHKSDVKFVIEKCESSKNLAEVESKSNLNICRKNTINEGCKKNSSRKYCKSRKDTKHLESSQLNTNSITASNCPTENNSCNNLCKKSGECLNKANTKTPPQNSPKLKKANNSLDKNTIYISVLKTSKKSSNTSLNSKSDSCPGVGENKKIPPHIYLHVCPLQANNDTPKTVTKHKNNCELTKDLPFTSEPPKLDKSENTDWHRCLSVILGCGKANRTDTETSTIGSMDSESATKKCFTNPNKKSKPTDLVECTIYTVKSKCTDSTKTSDVEKKPKCSYSESYVIKTQDSKPKIASEALTNDDTCQICSRIMISKEPCTCPDRKEQSLENNSSSKCSFKDNDTVKALMSAHCETMATIKSAMQDMACKAFTRSTKAATTAATIIKAESAKQIEKIKSFELPKDEVVCCPPCRRPCQDCRPKECCNQENAETPPLVAQPISHVEDDEEDEVSMPRKILDQLANKIGSTVKQTTENINIADLLKPNCFNDVSSTFDIPDIKYEKTNKPDNLSNVIEDETSTSGNYIFKSIASRILFMFSDREKYKKTLSSANSSASSESGASSDEDYENLKEK